MTDATTSRRCGNCGGVVGATDITCPHCDALLAAYEAPQGATAGTAAAVTPVDAPTPPAAPSTVADLPPVETPETTASPIATAVAATKAAAEQEEAEPSGKGPDEGWPLSSEPVSEALTETVDLTDLPNAAPEGLPTPTPSAAPSPVRETLAKTKAKVDTPPVTRVAPTPSPRSTPERGKAEPMPASAQRMRDRQERWTTKAPETKGTSKSRSDGASMIVIIFAIFIFMRVAGSNAFFGTLLTLGVVALVIWFVMRLANATGRKTTDMPRDDQWRRKR